MDETPPARSERFGAIFVIIVVAGSAVGVLGWHLLSNRGTGSMDSSGFDLDKAPQSSAPAALPSAPTSQNAPASSLGMLKADAGMSVAGTGSSSQNQNAQPAPGASSPQEDAAPLFTRLGRKYEGAVRKFAERMTRKYPDVRRYGQEWMRYPDLKKLNDDYAKERDPIKFLRGLSKSENFRKMVKEYAGSEQIRDFIVQGYKESPDDLKSAGMGVMKSEKPIQDMISSVGTAAGLPPTLMAMVDSNDAKPLDQNKVMGDIMNNPELQKAMQQGGQQAPAVNLQGR